MTLTPALGDREFSLTPRHLPHRKRQRYNQMREMFEFHGESNDSDAVINEPTTKPPISSYGILAYINTDFDSRN